MRYEQVGRIRDLLQTMSCHALGGASATDSAPSLASDWAEWLDGTPEENLAPSFCSAPRSAAASASPASPLARGCTAGLAASPAPSLPPSPLPSGAVPPSSAAAAAPSAASSAATFCALQYRAVYLAK